MLLVKFQYGEEGLLGHLHITDLLHALLASLLFLEQLTLTTDVAAIALGRDVLSHLFHGLTGYDFGSDGSLDGDVELLPGDELFIFSSYLSFLIDFCCKNKQISSNSLVFDFT